MKKSILKNLSETDVNGSDLYTNPNHQTSVTDSKLNNDKVLGAAYNPTKQAEH